MGWVGGGQGWRVGLLDWHPGFSFFVGRLARPPRGRGVWFEQGACSPADPLIGGLVGLGRGGWVGWRWRAGERERAMLWARWGGWGCEWFGQGARSPAESLVGRPVGLGRGGWVG